MNQQQQRQLHSDSNEDQIDEKKLKTEDSNTHGMPNPNSSPSADNNNAVSEIRQQKKIGTHNGTFHCDDVFACYMLRQLEEFKDAHIIRSRDPSKLNECDVVVDVGGVYDASCMRFDHHQKSFNETLSSILPDKTKYNTKLSSAGLIFAHFGLRVIASVVNKHEQVINNHESGNSCGDKNRTVNKSTDNDDEKLRIFYDLLYETFVEAVDAVDNGINISEGPARYIISTDISSRVSYLNTNWCDPDGQNEDVIYRQFEKAISLVGFEFEDRIMFYNNVWWPARMVVKRALDGRFKIHPSGEIMMFKEGACPWKDHLRMLEEEESQEANGNNATSLVKYVLYPDINGSWRIQCVPLTWGSFENRLSLPKSWRGLRDEELSKIANISGCVFVHVSGFIGGNKTEDGVLLMAVKALEIAKKEEEEKGEESVMTMS